MSTRQRIIVFCLSFLCAGGNAAFDSEDFDNNSSQDIVINQEDWQATDSHSRAETVALDSNSAWPVTL